MFWHITALVDEQKHKIHFPETQTCFVKFLLRSPSFSITVGEKLSAATVGFVYFPQMEKCTLGEIYMTFYEYRESESPPHLQTISSAWRASFSDILKNQEDSGSRAAADLIT